MIENLSKIQDRLTSYVAAPDRKFRTNSGGEPHDESLKQKVRQYWADESISNQQRLRGFDLDISGFDPRHTTNRELRGIVKVLVDLGIVDYDTAGGLAGIDVDYDARGNEISLDKPVDAYDYFERQLKFLNQYIAEGHSFAKDTLTKLNTAMTVMLALDDRARHPPQKSLVNIRV